MGNVEDAIRQSLCDFVDDQFDILTLGHDHQPTLRHWKIDRWMHPDKFAHGKEWGLNHGSGVIESGAEVRSSYHANEQSEKYTGVQQLNAANALAG